MKKRSTKTVIFLFLVSSFYSCSSFFGEIEIVSNCFAPYEQLTNKYIRNESGYLTLWYLSGDGSNDSFLMSKGIVGHIVEGKVTGQKERIGNEITLHFTGEVVKKSPNWSERHIGGSKKHSMRVVIYNNKRYLSLLTEEFDETWYNDLPEICKY